MRREIRTYFAFFLPGFIHQQMTCVGCQVNHNRIKRAAPPSAKYPRRIKLFLFLQVLLRPANEMFYKRQLNHSVSPSCLHKSIMSPRFSTQKLNRRLCYSWNDLEFSGFEDEMVQVKTSCFKQCQFEAAYLYREELFHWELLPKESLVEVRLVGGINHEFTEWLFR